MSVRKRVIPFEGPLTGTLITWTTTNPNRVRSVAKNDDVRSRLNGIQITESSSHPAWKARKSGSFKGDIGGPFLTRKRYAVSSNTAPVVLSNSKPINQFASSFATYSGPMLPSGPHVLQFPPYSESSGDTLDELGATAISRCAPTNPAADLTVFAAELAKEGIPKLVGSFLSKMRGASNRERRRVLGKEYLNVEFGWKPIINDLKKMSSSILHADAVMRQYERDSGRLVRRRYEFPPFEQTTTTVVATDVSPWYNPSTSTLEGVWTDLNKGYVVRTHELSRRQWFSGAFIYYVPPVDGSLQTDIARGVIKAKKLLGLSLTPDNLWNIAPWSWAIDWFANVGDNINNWTNWAIDNQVLAYGYMMEHTVSKYTYTFVGPTGYIPKGARPPSVEMVSETKLRHQASPYGFGLTYDGLTGRQKAIVAALGLTKSK